MVNCVIKCKQCFSNKHTNDSNITQHFVAPALPAAIITVYHIRSRICLIPVCVTHQYINITKENINPSTVHDICAMIYKKIVLKTLP